MKKQAICFLLALLTAGSLALPVHAASAEVRSKIYLNKVPVTPGEYEQVNDTYYVTVRGFMAALDPEAMVEEENGTVTVSAETVASVTDVSGGQAAVKTETLTFSASAGISYITANGRNLYVPDGNRLVNGAVAVPVRVLAKVFNMVVWYDNANNVAMLTHLDGTDAYLESCVTYYNGDILYWLAHIINAESGNQSLMGKIAVGNVVMNRIASPQFPNDIYSVLFQRNQFSPAINGSIYREPTAESWVAARLVLEGVVAVRGALFFNLAGMNTYAARNRAYIATIGDHAFYA